ncbi:MAG: ABC transporter substrate-binding protein [Thermoplasmatales archaeon]|nr:ABC transporter substrate-binding protein [Thermoplasmatales archaeon]
MNTKLLAVAVVAIVCVGAVAVYFGLSDDDNDGTITIVDGSGATITLDGPLTGLVTVNTNAPKAMKMLGLEDEVKGLCFYASSDAKDLESWNQFKDMFPEAVHMSRISSTSALMSGEEIIDTAQVRYVLCPVSNMTLSPSSQVALEQLNITVIRLDFNGDTAQEDLDKLATLFGRTESVMNALNSYLDVYNSVVDTVKTKAAEADNSDKTFLYLMSAKGGGKFYNQTSASNNLVESVYGKNALRNIPGLDLGGVTNAAFGDTNIKEVVIAEDGSNNIDKIFVRGSSTTTDEAAALTLWKSGGSGSCALSSDYTSLSAIGSDSTGKIYVFNSGLMSGPLAYIGYVLVAEACDIDTGYNVSQLITNYNNAYGFNEDTSGCLFKITISGGVASASEIVII